MFVSYLLAINLNVFSSSRNRISVQVNVSDIIDEKAAYDRKSPVVFTNWVDLMKIL